MIEKVLEAYRSAQKRLLFLDYDGTLVPFTRIPSEARVDAETRQTLATLSTLPGNRIIVISGRDRNFLDEQFEGVQADLIAEHGFFVRKDGNRWKPAEGLDNGWKEDTRSILEKITTIIPGTFREEKETSMVLHYRAAERIPCEVEEVRNLLGLLQKNHAGIDIMYGNRIIEIKQGGFSKGTAAMAFLKDHSFDFILALGDDVTDETLFRELKETAYTIKVGFGPTEARHRLPFQKDVLPFLKGLL